MASTMTKLVIRFKVAPIIEERKGYWSAFLPRFGITVYTHDQVTLQERARFALQVWISNFAPNPGPLAVTKIREYLDRHHVQHIVIKEPLRKKVTDARWLASSTPSSGAEREFVFAAA